VLFRSKLPVLFWIHGGAFVGGASNLYRLDKLASEGRMVVVTANYRLGFLGFVPLPGLSKESVNGNFGIEDQREALRWIQRNISTFGGDPKNVTISGESAGGAAVCMHLSSPDRVKGLFQKAIIVSAGCLATLKTTPEAITTIGKVITSELGCPKDSDLACLRKKSVTDILKAQTKFAEEHPTDLAIFSPTPGTVSHPNATIPTSISNALNRENGGQFSTVPLIMGGMEKELLLYAGYWWQEALGGKGPALDNQTINKIWLENFYGQHAKAVAKKYGFDNPKVGAHRLGEALSDFNPLIGINNCLYYRTADRVIAYPNTLSTYLFEFADPNALVKGVGIMPPYPDFPLGSVHSSILNYWFPNYSNNKKINAPDLPQQSQALADQMIQYLAAFVATGHPKVSGMKSWPAYNNSQHIFKFSPDFIGQFNGGLAHHCEWWKALYPNP
jgi:para-nitrobenzyl esterase